MVRFTGRFYPVAMPACQPDAPDGSRGLERRDRRESARFVQSLWFEALDGRDRFSDTPQ